MTTYSLRQWSASVQVMACCLFITKPFPEPMLTYHHKFFGIHLRAISQEVLMNLIHKSSFKNTLLKLTWHPPGANELTSVLTPPSSYCVNCAENLMSLPTSKWLHILMPLVSQLPWRPGLIISWLWNLGASDGCILYTAINPKNKMADMLQSTCSNVFLSMKSFSVDWNLTEVYSEGSNW